MKLCKDCKHFRHPHMDGNMSPLRYGWCSHKKNLHMSPVTGDQVMMLFAQDQRMEHSRDDAFCGPEAKWFEPRT